VKSGVKRMRARISRIHVKRKEALYYCFPTRIPWVSCEWKARRWYKKVQTSVTQGVNDANSMKRLFT